jgi:hypothetical protein
MSGFEFENGNDFSANPSSLPNMPTGMKSHRITDEIPAIYFQRS